MKTFNKLTFIAIVIAIFFIGACKKESVFQSSTSSHGKTITTNTVADSMMLTPEGLMPKSHVHLVENGYRLEIRAGHMLKIQTATNKLMEDFGKIEAPPGGQKNNLQNPINSNFNGLKSMAPSGNGWVTYSEWGNGNGQPINLFSTNWIVPGTPGTNDGQLLYIWDGLEPYQVEVNNPGNLVMQPVLQWGSNGTGAGTF